jgi:hypothetical protein
METRRLTIEVDGQGNLKITHDDFQGSELAAFALIVQDIAMEVLRNGPQRDVQISGPRHSDGVR